MYDSLEELTQIPVFYFFSEVSKIPRCSGNEQAISDYLVRFSEERSLEVFQDDSLNVIIKKPATPGYEHIPAVIIQGHMDMVCEKNEDMVHDFERDPLQLRIKGNMLYATDTTLGADNGVAIAYALALLDADDISHPALEIVITTEEETSMKGALTVDPTHFDGKTLINIDMVEDHKLLVSGAGGLQAIQTIPIEWQTTPKNLLGYGIRIVGLKGGHSGTEIDQEQGNANKLMGRVLYDLSVELSYVIVHVNGGIASNAIPREALVMIALSEGKVGLLQDKIEKWNRVLKNELAISDPGVYIELERMETIGSRCLSEETKQRLVGSLMLLPNGVQSMSVEIEGLVESSINLGVVKTTEVAIKMESDVRSSVKTRKDTIVNQSRLVAESLGCDFTTISDYPEWPYNPDSAIRKLFEKVYREREGNDIKVTAVHAGNECGIFIDKIQDLDAISIGPDLFQIHTPNEHVSIPSMLHNWQYFLAVLKAMA